MHFRIRMGRRMIWLSVVFLLMFSGLSWRLAAVQIKWHDDLAHQAVAQRTLKLEIGGNRGQIYDRNGVPLNDPQAGWGVAAFPTLAKDPESEAEELSALLGLPYWKVRASLTAKQGTPVWLAEQVSASTAEEIRRLNLTGVVVAQQEKRYGPGSLAHHLVGLANRAGHRSGLEMAYDRELSGDAVPHLAAAVDGRSRLLNGAIQELVPTVGKEPYNLYTTIDAGIQRAVEGVLDRWRDPDGQRLGKAAVVVMDPHTGDLLAMASRPDFNPEDGQGGSQMNWAITPFEPGSVFKPVYAAYALEHGLVRLDEQFNARSYYEVGGQKFYEYGKVAHGKISFQEAIALSSNVVFAQVGYERLKAPGLMAAARLFRFGQAAGILSDAAGGDAGGTAEPLEAPGLLPDLSNAFGGIVAQAAFGQGGIMVTPLQMARAYSAIANGGSLPPVRLVTAIKDPAGKVMDRPQAGLPERIFSVETAGELQAALAGVTSPRGQGTGRKAWVPGYGSAGKTGSADGTADGPDGKPYPATHAWFAGYTPLADPRYVIVILRPGEGVDRKARSSQEAGSDNLGSEKAAPVFKAVAEAILALPEQP